MCGFGLLPSCTYVYILNISPICVGVVYHLTNVNYICVGVVYHLVHIFRI